MTEFVIVGKDQVEAISKILALMKAHRVELLGLESHGLPDTLLFVIALYTNTKGSDRTLDELLGLIRGLLSVESARGEAIKGSQYDKFLFPIVALDSSRLVITTAANLAEIEEHFARLPRESGRAVLFEAARQSGLAIARAMRRSSSHLTQKEMLTLAEDELRTSGWGLFKFDAAKMEKGSVEVTVKDPIMMNIPGAKESWWTYGLSAGLVEGIFGVAGEVREQHPYSEAKREIKFLLFDPAADQGGHPSKR